MILVLFDMDDRPVGRASLTGDNATPAAVVWNDRVYMYDRETIAGFRYRQVLAYEIPVNELRKAPGLG